MDGWLLMICSGTIAFQLWFFMRMHRRRHPKKDQIDMLLETAREAAKPKLFMVTIKYDPSTTYCYGWAIEPKEDSGLTDRIYRRGTAKHLMWARWCARASLINLNKRYGRQTAGTVEEWEG